MSIGSSIAYRRRQLVITTAFSILATLIGFSLMAARPNELTIVFFGDSVTKGGRNMPKDRIFTKLIEDEMVRRGTPVSVFNAGFGGDDTFRAMKRFDRDVMAHRPAFVFMMFGLNDADYVDNGPVARTTPRVSVEDFRNNLITMCREVSKAGGKPVLLTPNPFSQRYQYATFGIYQKKGIDFVLPPYVQAIKKIGKELGVPVVDVFGQFKKLNNLNDYLSDGIHPNPAGHRLIADLILKYLSRQKLIQRMKNSSLASSLIMHPPAS